MSTEPLNKKVILFNGPPHVGKDTATIFTMNYISKHASWMQPRHMKISEPLKKATHAAYGMFQPWNHYDSPKHSAEKDIPTADFLGLTPRLAYINMSDWMKNEHGDEVFGYIMRKRMLQSQGCMCFVLSDCGFAPELAPIVKLVGEANVMLVELHAVDRTFEGDSRGYVGAELAAKFPKMVVRKIQNTIGDEDDLEIFKMMCHGVTKSFLQIEEKEQ